MAQILDTEGQPILDTYGDVFLDTYGQVGTATASSVVPLMGSL
jgi:hypothetical protein